MIQISKLPVFGDKGPSVEEYQKALMSKGMDLGKFGADGDFGIDTKSATSQYQKSIGLLGSGSPGPLTLKSLGMEILPLHGDGGPAMTSDLKGRQDRHLHPDKRLQIESVMFPQRVVPKLFLDAKNKVDGALQDCYAELMKACVGFGWHEIGGQNMGQDVGEIQGTTGAYTPGGNGDAWCDDFAQMGIAFLEDYFQSESPVPASAHCMTTYRGALKVEGLVSKSAEKGTLALGKHGDTDDGHAMSVLEVHSDGTMTTAEGNASNKSMIKTRDQHKNGDLVTQGWVRIYPFNKLP